MSVSIIHNPRCTKSRQALSYLIEKGIDPEVRLYLKDELSETELKEILVKLSMTPQELLRKNEAIFRSEFKGKEHTDEEWIKIMTTHPKLIERPIIIKGDKAVVARPTEEIDKLI